MRLFRQARLRICRFDKGSDGYQIMIGPRPNHNPVLHRGCFHIFSIVIHLFYLSKKRHFGKTGFYRNRLERNRMMEEVHEWQRQLREEFEKIVASLREALPSSPLSPSPSHPTLEASVNTLEQKALSVHRKIAQSIHLFSELIPELSTIDPYVSKQEVLLAIHQMQATGLAMMNAIWPTLKTFQEGKPLQEIVKISDQTLQTLYKLTRYLFEQQHYEQACSAFYFLSLLNPAYHEFWIGLGNCEYILKRYSEAILAYTFAMQTDPFDPLVNLLVGRCYLGVGNTAAAKASLALAETKPVPDESFRRQLENFRQDVQKASL